MAQFVEANVKSMRFAAVLGAHLRVKYDGSGYAAVAGATDPGIGTNEAPVLAADVAAATWRPMDVRLWTAFGTRKMVAAGAIAAYAKVYGAAGGKIDDTGTGLAIGYACEAATADDDVIEVIPVAMVEQAAGVFDTATVGVLTLSTSAGGAGSTFVPLIPIAAPEDIAAGNPGALSIATYITTVDTDADADAFTLADGAVIGQLKKVKLVTDGGGDAVITPATFIDGTTVTMADAGDFVVFAWTATGWRAIELGNEVDGVSAPAIA